MLNLKYKNINDDTNKSLNEILALDLPIKEGIKIAKISKHINTHIEIKTSFEKKILEKYAQKDENGVIKAVKDEAGNIVPNQIYISDPDGYNKELKELESQEFEIPGDMIHIDVLGLDKIKPTILLNLDWLINLEDVEATETSKS
jgi:hypothetical protein